MHTAGADVMPQRPAVCDLVTVDIILPIRHCLPCYAGVMGPSSSSTPAGSSTPSSSTSDQVPDQHMLVNHLGPFLLTGLLLPQMASGSRIVNVSSRAHFSCKSLHTADNKLSSGSDWW